jgi:type IV secretory pathway TrbD component
VHAVTPGLNRFAGGTIPLPGTGPDLQIRKDDNVVLLLAFLVVLALFGLGFAVHLLWIAAVIFLVVWLVGFALGRGESAGSHRFYRW